MMTILTVYMMLLKQILEPDKVLKTSKRKKNGIIRLEKNTYFVLYVENNITKSLSYEKAIKNHQIFRK